MVHTFRSRPKIASLLALGLGATVAACGGNSDKTPTGNNGGGNGGTPAAIAAVSGGGQRRAAGARLADPFVVKVTDDAGQGVSGVTVTWAVAAGGGTLSSASAQTNSTGQASVTLTLGDGAGTNRVTASAEGLSGSPVAFTANGVAPASVEVVSGDAQEARISKSVADPLVVLVKGTDGPPLPGATVQWSVTGGGGSLSDNTTATDDAGQAAVTLTVGPAVGANTAEASVSGVGTSASFTAQGSQPVLVTVQMKNIAFVAPGGGKNVTILLGDTVRWVNQDAVQHTATSNQDPGGASFDSGLLNQGQEFRFVPGLRGTWIYFCQVHPTQMNNAQINVN